ncbi:hypothetical protein [Cryptosporangium minutisporangium]|uniref:DUF1269 domain-containing protein n=1 Tax=Cryptosporangium minutisporangium TaxID=113569 RepID=A0ABP6SXC9_9ACTN
MAPVQVLVVGFDRPAFSGEVLAELTRLRHAGIVRLIDLLLVARAADGTLETLTAPAGVGAGLGGLAIRLLARPEVEADGEEQGPESDPSGTWAWSLADAVPAGSAAAVALIEHLWAEPLAAAIRRAGGTSLNETWLATYDLARLEALVAQRPTSDVSMSQ